MANVRRLVRIAGIGMPRTWYPGLSGVTAYDDLTVFLGVEQFTISDGVKIFGVSLPFLTEEPDISGQNIDYFDPSQDFGGTDVDLQLHKYFRIRDLDFDSTHEWYGELLSAFFNQGKVRPWATFIEDTANELQAFTWAEHTETDWIYVETRPRIANPPLGETIFWGREALQLTTIESGSWSFGTRTANVRFKAIKRCYGTLHERRFGPDNPRDDVELYIRNHIVLSREIDIYDYDVNADEMNWAWGGYIDTPEAQDVMNGIHIPAIGRVGEIHFQKYAQSRAFWFQSVNDDNQGSYSLHRRRMPLLPIPTGAEGVAPTFSTVIACRQEDAVILAQYDELDETNGLTSYQVTPISGALMGTLQSFKNNKDAKDRGAIEEVVIGDPFWSHFKFDEGGAFIEYSTHPFDVVRALWSTKTGKRITKYDVLPEGWGLGIDHDRINHTEIDDLKSGAFGGASWLYVDLEMRGIILGEDAEEEVWQAIDRILKPIMCVATLDNEGKHTIRTLIDLGPEYVQYAYQNDDTKRQGLRYVKTEHTPVREVKYNIARRGLSGKFSGEIRATDLRRTVRNRYGGLAEDETLSAIDYGEPGVVPESWLAQPGIRALIYFADIRYSIRNSGVHYYNLALDDPGTKFRIADTITISHQALYNEEGGRGFTDRRMMVLSYQQNAPSRGYDHMIKLIDIEGLNSATQLIAPSWLLGKQTSPDPLVYELNEAPTHMRVGMQILLADPNFREYNPGETRTVTAIGALNFTVDVAFSFSPGQDDVILLADYSFSASEELDDYAWISDKDGDLGLAQDEGHRWGF